MPTLTLEAAELIVKTALKTARDKKFLPLGVAVLDARGALKAFMAEDGTSLKRAEIAIGKAHGAVAFGLGSRALAARATAAPHFIAAATHAVGGLLVPVPGGVLIKSEDGEVLGAVGVSGDNSDNDEIAALAGIAAAGFKADTGA